MAAEAKVEHVQLFFQNIVSSVGKFHLLVKSFKQELRFLKRGKDEESVDKTVLQKYHRGGQNRFKVCPACFLNSTGIVIV